MTFDPGDLIRLPNTSTFVEVRMAAVEGEQVRIMYVDADGSIKEARVVPGDVEVSTEDGQAPSADLLAAFWAAWMSSATTSVKSAALASSTLKPYPHQHEAVYGRMLPQPAMRFLLGDEPGTGKTVMGGLFARESERLGTVARCLVVCPAHLVTKWQADFERFFGGGLERIENDTVKNNTLSFGLAAGQGFWVVSLELAAMNSAVLEAIQPDVASWDLVIVDEAHRMTPTAQSYYTVGRVLKDAPRFLAMTATPHRGNEWYFRSLMHLIDPEIYPDVEGGIDEHVNRLRPGDLHLLRRMKESLTGYDGQEPLFSARTAANLKVSLSSTEKILYDDALEMVDEFFPKEARTLGRMVYGKRTASCLRALDQTLGKRSERMGTKSAIEARRDDEVGDPTGDDDAAQEHGEVIFTGSTDVRGERQRIKELRARINDYLDSGPASETCSKWPSLVDHCLGENGIVPGNFAQGVVFTEYADTADWLVEQLRAAGFTAERYSGRDTHRDRDEVRAKFMSGEFQVIVSTDAGNEGIDLQSSHVLVNWDIPWSLVTLEQRMGRIHRVGQNRDVLLYNMIATGTIEGATLGKLLDRLVTAANEMGGKMFDCLSLVGQAVLPGDDPNAIVPLGALFADPSKAAAAVEAVEAITTEQLRAEAEKMQAESKALASTVDFEEAVSAIQDGELERINPHIVERYLARLAGAGLLTVEPGALGDHIFHLGGTSAVELPKSLRKGSGTMLIATVGKAKQEQMEAGNAVAGAAVEIGPSTAPFRALVKTTYDHLRPTLSRGGQLQDATTVTDYTLHLYETTYSEGSGVHERTGVWRHLIRTDNTGGRVVPFELLNNLVPAGVASQLPHPADQVVADGTAATAVADRKTRREDRIRDWNKNAKRQLERLPSEYVRGIEDPTERAQTRDRVKAAVTARLGKLDTTSDVTVGETKRIGWAEVVGAGEIDDPTKPNSELIAMKHVSNLLTAGGWKVADVSAEKLGFDITARRGHIQRCVEVKGVWNSASSDGIRITGHEMIRAAILGDDYWLYVVDQCNDKTGTLYGVYQDPTDLFALGDDQPIRSIKGSLLKARQTIENAA